MTQVDGLVGLIFLALKVLALVGAVYAIVHAVRQRPDAFTAVNKLTKPIWLGILIVAALNSLGDVPCRAPGHHRGRCSVRVSRRRSPARGRHSARLFSLVVCRTPAHSEPWFPAHGVLPHSSLQR